MITKNSLIIQQMLKLHVIQLLYCSQQIGSKRDPRPIYTTEFQMQCFQTISKFFVRHGFPPYVSNKSILSPTRREFLSIINYLFQRVNHYYFSYNVNIFFNLFLKLIDPSFVLKPEYKPDNEISLLFRRLGYPFRISKSSFYAIGSPITWPVLLAAIVWLLPLLECIEQIEQNQTARINMGNVSENEVFYQYYTKAYTYFLAGNDAKGEELDKKLDLTFQKRSNELSKEIKMYLILIIIDIVIIYCKKVVQIRSQETQFYHKI